MCTASEKKEKLPLLEFDPCKNAVIAPDHEKLGLELPRRAILAFLGEYVDEYAKAHNAGIAAEFVSITKKYPVYILDCNGEQVCLCQAPMGAPPAVQFMEWLISYGVEAVISTGSCGVLRDLPENAFLIPVRALRDEGTSFHYAPPSRYIDVDPRGAGAVESALREHHLPFERVTTWTTDAFFRETREKVAARREEGCTVVDMECSALAACARFRGTVWGQLLFTADSLANADRYDERSWGVDSFGRAMALCLDAVMRL